MVPYYWTRHRCERIDCRRNNTSNVITLWGLWIDAIFLHRSLHFAEWCPKNHYCIKSSMSADWWLMHDSCFSHHSVRSVAWRNITSKVTTLCGELTWWNIITSVITIWGQITDARLLSQSSLCADWRLTHYY